MQEYRVKTKAKQRPKAIDVASTSALIGGLQTLSAVADFWARFARDIEKTDVAERLERAAGTFVKIGRGMK